ncbi:hypothetical protein ABZZ80_36000 [Streptomyces sp. NPDC006356]
MAETALTETTVAEVLAELAELDDPRIRAVNEKHGAGLLDVIEAEMKAAPDRLQWAMNHCLAQIGIEHAEYRTRALAIGERLEVLKDYPTSPGCTSPFAPVWIAEMVRRKNDT